MKLYAPSTIEAIKEKYRFQLSRSLGQNFITDKHVIERIVEGADPLPEDLVIEIGPGIGVLTAEAARQAAKVVAIEIDSKLIPILGETLAEYDNVEIVNQDILKADLNGIIDEQRASGSFTGDVKIIGNLPYYITTPIIMHILENSIRAESITVVESKGGAENVTRTSNNSYFTDALYYELLNDLQEKANYTAEEASSLIFNGGLRVYSTVDPKVQNVIEEELYNADDAIPALWHEAPVALRDYPADTSSWDDVQYDEATGLPITKDGYAVYGVEDIPVYDDDAETELKKGTSTDPNYPNDDTVYLCVYEKVRTEASAAILDYNGNILGIGGGIGEKQYDLGTNRATVPHQTGSTMKPIGAYCLALDYGLINYSSQILDAPFYSAADKEVLKEQYSYMDKYSAAAQSRNDIWRDWPTNYGGAGGQGNPMLVYDALRQSYNTVAVWVGNMVGVDYLYNFVHDTLECSYISAENDMDLAPLVLGGQSRGMTVVQLAGAYSIFNDGTFTSPHYYTEVEDYLGNTVLDNTKYINTTQAISPETAQIMNRMLANVLKTGSTASSIGVPEAGGMDAVAKTGTTSNNKDYTFAALTPYYVTALWWGFDRPEDMSQYSGGKYGTPIQKAWKNMMEELQADLPYKEFATSENVVEKHFDTSTGAIISGGGAIGYYTEDNMPDSSYAASTDDDPYAALAQAAAEGAQAGDTTTEPTE